MLLKIDTQVDGDTLTVKLSGEFDMGSIGNFREAVEGGSEPWERAEIDLATSSSWTRRGSRSCAAQQPRARKEPRGRADEPSAPVMRLLELTGLHSHFTIRD